MIACDILGPLPTTATGNKYVLVIGDYFTRWMEALAFPNQEAPTIAQKLVNELFCRFSMPEQLHSDQGRQFESILIAEICKILHIHKTRTTPYYPQGDGMVERLNCTLVNMLATSISDLEDDSWEEYLPKVCLAYTTCTHPTTGETPFFLMYGRQAHLPVDLMYGTKSTGTTVSEYAKELGGKLSMAFEQTRKRTGCMQQRQRELYNKHIKLHAIQGW